jgi:hypothetical protein
MYPGDVECEDLSWVKWIRGGFCGRAKKRQREDITVQLWFMRVTWSSAPNKIQTRYNQNKNCWDGGLVQKLTCMHGGPNIFGRTYHLHLQGWRLSQASHQERERAELDVCFLLVSCLAPLPSWRWRQHVTPKYTALQPREQYSSQLHPWQPQNEHRTPRA